MLSVSLSSRILNPDCNIKIMFMNTESNKKMILVIRNEEMFVTYI